METQLCFASKKSDPSSRELNCRKENTHWSSLRRWEGKGSISQPFQLSLSTIPPPHLATAGPSPALLDLPTYVCCNSKHTKRSYAQNQHILSKCCTGLSSDLKENKQRSALNSRSVFRASQPHFGNRVQMGTASTQSAGLAHSEQEERLSFLKSQLEATGSLEFFGAEQTAGLDCESAGCGGSEVPARQAHASSFQTASQRTTGFFGSLSKVPVLNSVFLSHLTPSTVGNPTA